MDVYDVVDGDEDVQSCRSTSLTFPSASVSTFFSGNFLVFPLPFLLLWWVVKAGRGAKQHQSVKKKALKKPNKIKHLVGLVGLEKLVWLEADSRDSRRVAS